MSLRKTIQQSFNDFWICIRGDKSPFNSFLSTCTAIKNSINTPGALEDPETLIAAQSYVSQIGNFASDMLQLEKNSHIISNDHMSDIVRILDNQMEKLVIVEDKNPSVLGKEKSKHPAYIQPCHQWLLSNLHNPYPSKVIKKDISHQTNCSIKDIDAWFIDVRKRIGWNKIRKVHFQNKQDKIIAAATNVFRPQSQAFSDNPDSTLVSEVEAHETYRSEFIVMANLAKYLYINRYPDSVGSPLYMPEAVEVHEQASPQITGASSPDTSALSYPTPEPSPPSYLPEELQPVTSPQNTSQVNQTSNPLKRRHSSSEFSEDNNVDCATPHRKQSKCNSMPSCPVTTSPLPSRVNSPNVTNESSSTMNVQNSAPTPLIVPESTARYRKRRLSDGEGQGPSKRPHPAFNFPRLQTVSNPYPATNSESFDGWPCDNTSIEQDLSDTIPSPANSENPISLGPLALDLQPYDFSSNSELFSLQGFDHSDPVVSGQLLSPLFSLSHSCLDSGLAFFQSNEVPLDLATSQLEFVYDPLLPSNKSDLPPLIPGYLADPSSFLHDNSRDLRCSPVVQRDTSVFDLSDPPGFVANNTEQDARRARAQALRAELAQLVAEGL